MVIEGSKFQFLVFGAFARARDIIDIVLSHNHVLLAKFVHLVRNDEIRYE